MPGDRPKEWSAEDLLALGRGYQAAAVFLAAAELDVFAALANGPLAADAVAARLQSDPRGMTTLLDALAALRVITKEADRYRLPAGLEVFLTAGGARSILAMAHHQANCLRNWAQLARVVKTGRPADRTPSVRGEAGDQAAFIGAMDNISAPVADEIIAALQPLQFAHLLDVGGASGTWTRAFLRACPSATATLFDLPQVIPMARRGFEAAGCADRVRLVEGDFETDALPSGADLVWLSAIVHQNSRAQNRALFAKAFAALAPGGRIAIRDIVMENDRTHPVAGALFAINMLVATAGGGTFTFDDLREDLASAGFVNAAMARRDEGMHSMVVAKKPTG